MRKYVSPEARTRYGVERGKSSTLSLSDPKVIALSRGEDSKSGFGFVSVLTIQLLVCFASVANAAILSFDPPAALHSNAATDSGDDFEPQVTPDDARNWVAVWESTDSLGGTIGTDSDILISRSREGALNEAAAGEGRTRWSPPFLESGATFG